MLAKQSVTANTLLLLLVVELAETFYDVSYGGSPPKAGVPHAFNVSGHTVLLQPIPIAIPKA